MDVRLAGFNLDRDLLEEVKGILSDLASGRGDPEAARAMLDSRLLTPETISAAYARISRDPRPVGELRAQARLEVAAARRSNRRIIFGMGHASIAEHACFNFDLVGLSRLAAELVERHRLCSFTEKSQRFVVLDEGHAVPAEIRRTPLEEEYQRLAAAQAGTYRDLLELLSGSGPPDESSREDARYALPLAVETQLGMTLNARNLELLLRRLGSHPLEECRRLGRDLFREVDGLAPSLIKYVEPGPDELKQPGIVAGLAARRAAGCPAGAEGRVRLLRHTPEPDRAVLLALLFPTARASAPELTSRLEALPAEEVGRDLRAALAHLGPHDPAPRAFEVASFTFEVVLSAACYAQLKRHRMATHLEGPYDPDLGPVIPATVRDAGGAERLEELAERAAVLSRRIREVAPAAAGYPLLNAHRRRLMLRLNARELLHLSRLRMDHHAQWEIREIAAEMIRQARDEAPHALCLACGKDGFQERRRREGFA